MYLTHGVRINALLSNYLDKYININNGHIPKQKLSYIFSKTNSLKAFHRVTRQLLLLSTKILWKSVIFAGEIKIKIKIIQSQSYGKLQKKSKIFRKRLN